MQTYKNLKLSSISSYDVAPYIIRQTKHIYIVGIIDTPSIFLHKRKRFRPRGLFCEEAFGRVYICKKRKCTKLKFNRNLVFNNICKKCDRKMIYNINRAHRVGAVCFNFPILNFLYYNMFMKSLKGVKMLKYIEPVDVYSETFYKSYDYIDSYINVDIKGYLILGVFLNFVNLFYKFISTLEILKNKLNLIKESKNSIFKYLNLLNLNIANINLFKNAFILLFPILPIGLRNYMFTDKHVILNSKFNLLYTFIIDTNNKIFNKDYYFNYNVKYIYILFCLIKIVLTHAQLQFIFKDQATIYSRLQGKYGLFRQNLLGFRVDYSGRTVIVPGPDILINEVGLPVTMLQDSLNSVLLKYGDEPYEQEEEIQEIDEENEEGRKYRFTYNDIFKVIPKFSFLINRAPTLHKMNTQSFGSVFSEGRALKFMPILCSGYNADFDGDQMGVFSVLLDDSILESSYMMRPITNLISPTNNKNIFNLTQGILLGENILSTFNYFNFIEKYVINNLDALVDIKINNIAVNSPILLRDKSYFYLTTVGRVMLNIKYKTNEY